MKQFLRNAFGISLLFLAIVFAGCDQNGGKEDNRIVDDPAKGIMSVDTAKSIFDIGDVSGGVRINKFKSASSLSRYLNGGSGRAVAGSTELIINKIGDKPVVEIGAEAFVPVPGNPDTYIINAVSTIKLPATITAIAADAFSPDAKVELKIPQSVLDSLDDETKASIEESAYVEPETPDEATADEHIAKAFGYLQQGRYDNAIASFEAAYTADQENNEAVVYSALAKLAAISTDSKVAELMQSKLGLKSYPRTMNALLSDSWLREYKDTVGMWSNDIEVSETGTYVRVNGRLLTWDEKNNSLNNYPYVNYVHATEDNNSLNWVYEADYRSYILNRQDLSYYIEIEEFSDTGKYLVSYNDLLRINTVIPENSNRYNINWENEELIYILDESCSSFFPELNVPDWFKDTEGYKGSVVGSVETSETMINLLLANALTGNVNGLNGLIDGILDGVFGESFEAACSRINELDLNERIDIPAEFIAYFNLESVLDEYPTQVGKAELQVLTSAMRLLKGTFQWIASYNLNTDLSILKFDWADEAALEILMGKIQGLISAGKDPFQSGFLGARSNGPAMMEASKNSFTKALGAIGESYVYLVSEANTSYPKGVKDMMTEMLSPYLVILNSLLSAIESSGILYISPDDMSVSTDPSASASAMPINIGTFFTPGTFSLKNLIAVDGTGKPIFYIQGAEGERVMTAGDMQTITEDTYVGVKILMEPWVLLMETSDGPLPVENMRTFVYLTPELALLLYDSYY